MSSALFHPLTTSRKNGVQIRAGQEAELPTTSDFGYFPPPSRGLPDKSPGKRGKVSHGSTAAHVKIGRSRNSLEGCDCFLVIFCGSAGSSSRSLPVPHKP